MLGRLWSRDRDDGGFTLIELLVVIIIIGILAAIAIPVFLNQRQKAADAGAKSDVRNLATAIETWAVDNPTGGYTSLSKTGLANASITPSKNVSLIIIQHDANGYCLAATNNGGSAAPANQAALSQTVVWWYDSQAGGLQPRNTPIVNFSGCPKTTGFAADVFNNVWNG